MPICICFLFPHHNVVYLQSCYCQFLPYLDASTVGGFFLNVIYHAGRKDEEELAQWWGHKYGFVSGGFLGAQSRTSKSGSSKDTGKGFAEEDQENLYKLVQVL